VDKLKPYNVTYEIKGKCYKTNINPLPSITLRIGTLDCTSLLNDRQAAFLVEIIMV
jgi:hypothetical protein